MLSLEGYELNAARVKRSDRVCVAMPGRNIINSVMGLLGKRHQASTQLSTELIPVRNESYEIEAATQLPIFRAEVLRVTITVGPTAMH
jgi:hypothetical protein